MKRTQRAGFLRLLATVALFLGLVSMHHLSLAQCDDLQHTTSVSSPAIAAEPAGMAMPVTAKSGPASRHSHSNSALGCACMLAMCLAILAFFILLRPQSPKDWLRIRERTVQQYIRIRQQWPPSPPDLLALSVSRT